MTTLINRVRNVSSKQNTKFNLVIGHGYLTGYTKKVPADTYIIFLSKPGYSISKYIPIRHAQLFNRTFLKNVISGKIPRTRVQPARLGMWKEHVYGPYDSYPEIGLEFFDRSSSNFNSITGIHSINSSGMNTQTFHGSNGDLFNIMRFGGKGIYIVMSCRTSGDSEITERAYINNFIRTRSIPGGNQMTLPRITVPGLNRRAQTVENIQARLAAHKRKNIASLSIRKSPRPTKKVAVEKFTFTGIFSPGRPVSRRRPTSRRPRSNMN